MSTPVQIVAEEIARRMLEDRADGVGVGDKQGRVAGITTARDFVGRERLPLLSS